MSFLTKSVNEIVQDALVLLQTNTNITKLSPGGKARAIIDIVGQVLREAYTEIDATMTKAFISSTSGQYLDLFGIMLGEPRLSSEIAVVESDMQNVKFYVDTGNFGTINNNNDIILTRGTLLSTSPDGTGIVYRVKYNTILPSTANYAWVAAEAKDTGSSYNVGSNSLIYHNFTNYTDEANETLKVNNIHAIANGKDYEIDTNYKYRLIQKVTSAEAANETALRLAALSVPGVADVIMKRHYRGIGTFGIIVKSIAPIATNSLIQSVRDKVFEKQGYGSIAYIKGQSSVGFSMKTRVWYNKSLTTDEYDAIEEAMISLIEDYVNNLDIGDTLSVDRIISQLYAVSSAIEGFGTRTTSIDEAFVYMPTLLQDNRVSRRLIGNYTPRNDEERVIIEPTLSNPIIFERKIGSRPVS